MTFRGRYIRIQTKTHTKKLNPIKLGDKVNVPFKIDPTNLDLYYKKIKGKIRLLGQSIWQLSSRVRQCQMSH